VSSRATLAQASFAFALGLVFAAAGASKLLAPAASVADFQRWGVPAAHQAVAVMGTVELTGALLLLTDVAPRLAATVLGLDMLAATLVAGLQDGGVQLVIPAVLAAGCAALALTRARSLRLAARGGPQPRVRAQPAQGTSTESSVGASRATTYRAGSESERFSRMWVSRGGT
jgi:uncharacterized membrane protein YphA (DoxX/SURF4 family)